MDRVMHGCESCDGEDECTCRLPVKQAEFKREPRYVVFKIKDILAYCSEDVQNNIHDIGQLISLGRDMDGKPPFNAVVVEQDWPEFDPTWAAIEARMSKTPNRENKQQDQGENNGTVAKQQEGDAVSHPLDGHPQLQQ